MRRYSMIKDIEVPVSNVSALPTEALELGMRRFVPSENTYYQWNGVEWLNTQLPFDLSIAPEILSIQVDAPDAGHGQRWLWTWQQSTLPYARLSITNSPEISVPIYKQGSYTIDNFAAYDLHGEMTQTHKFFLKWVEGAGVQNLVDWVTYSNVVVTHSNINSGISTNAQRLSFTVPSDITLPTLVAPNVTYNVTSNGSSAFSFSVANKGDNINLGPWRRGGTYIFNLNNLSGHPFYLTTDNGTNFSMGQYVGEYTTGVSGSRNTSGTLSITVANDAPSTLFYQCGNHSSMRGAITIKDLEVEVNVNGNYIIYGQHTQEAHSVPIEIRPIPSLVNQMCIVYDQSRQKFVPQDLATYVENTPSFENKIKEVAGTATLIAPDGVPVVAKVNIYNDSSYLPLTGNNNGDLAFSTDTEELYIWNTTRWLKAGANVNAAAISALSTANSYLQLSQSGNLTVTTGTKRWYAPTSINVSNVTAKLGTAPTGSSLVTVLKKNNVASSTLTFSASSTSSANSTAISMNAGDYFTVDILSVGSTVTGADLNLIITYTNA